MLNKPEDVKSMVKILLLQDTLPDKTTGLPGGTGSAIARELLTKFRLTANPDMGRIILNELKMPLNTRRIWCIHTAPLFRRFPYAFK